MTIPYDEAKALISEANGALDQMLEHLLSMPKQTENQRLVPTLLTRLKTVDAVIAAMMSKGQLEHLQAARQEKSDVEHALIAAWWEASQGR